MMHVSISKKLRDFDLDVAFELPTGQCVALVGPTGCGKTTTLRVIAGLETPDSGRIDLDGVCLADTERGIMAPPDHRQLGMVFQDYALFPHMSVLRNVMYGPHVRRAGRARAQKAAYAAIEKVRLTGLEHLKPGELSGGQRQRAAVARAIANDPKALLMDEPMSALDAATRRHVRAELKSLITEVGTQTLIVTHDVVDALSLGDVLCVMDEGRIVQTGERKELLSRPRNQFVADFLGMNWLPCTASPGPNGLCNIRCGEATFYSVDQAEGKAFLTCSPSDISLSHEEPSGSALNVFKGRIADIAHLGSRTRVTVEKGISLTAEITHSSEERLDLQPGGEIYAHFKASAVRVYE